MGNGSGQAMNFRQHSGLYHVTVRQKQKDTDTDRGRERGGGREGEAGEGPEFQQCQYRGSKTHHHYVFFIIILYPF